MKLSRRRRRRHHFDNPPMGGTDCICRLHFLVLYNSAGPGAYQPTLVWYGVGCLWAAVRACPPVLHGLG